MCCQCRKSPYDSRRLAQAPGGLLVMYSFRVSGVHGEGKTGWCEGLSRGGIGNGLYHQRIQHTILCVGLHRPLWKFSNLCQQKPLRWGKGVLPTAAAMPIGCNGSRFGTAAIGLSNFGWCCKYSQDCAVSFYY